MGKKLLSHISIILALVFLTMFILWQFNPWIIDTGFFTIIAYAFGGVALITSILFAACLRRE